MAQNFLSCDRDQELLLPPSLREWLPEDHLVWFVLDSVAEMDLAAFNGAYRQDGWGRAAHDPARGRFARSPIRKVAAVTAALALLAAGPAHAVGGPNEAGNSGKFQPQSTPCQGGGNQPNCPGPH
jgi:hypothetical protein